MKMTRSKLKGIVKECLVEILSEGISSSTDSNELSESNQRKKQIAMKNEKERLQKHRKNLESKIDSTVSNITNNSVMQDILADTARTTLQEQMKHDGQSGAGQLDDPGISLDHIFSKSSNVWSQLAFGDEKNS